MKKVIQYFVRFIVWGGLTVAAAALVAWYYDYGNKAVAGTCFLIGLAAWAVFAVIREQVYVRRMRNGKRGR